MSKNIEFFNLPDGALFSSYWMRNRTEELSYYYRCSVELEKHKFKQSKQNFLSRLIFGKAKTIDGIVTRKYNYDDVRWMNSSDIVYPNYTFKEYRIEIFADGEAETSRDKVLDTFYEIVNACPSDDVLVFGYGIKGSENKIQPEMIPAGKNEWSASINCGFAGF